MPFYYLLAYYDAYKEMQSKPPRTRGGRGGRKAPSRTEHVSDIDDIFMGL
jgi:hypothetical protein